MNKNLKTTLIIVGIIIVLGIILLLLRGDEDTWIKDSRGVWIKHGNPKNTPSEVVEQEELISKAQELYNQAKQKSTDFSAGPCLGLIENDWVLDIAHSPREAVDNQPENQCSDFRTDKANHFIELDLEGNIVKIH